MVQYPFKTTSLVIKNHVTIGVNSVADPGFTCGGANPRRRFLFGDFYFAKNCMKMKEFEPREGASLALSLDLPLQLICTYSSRTM